MPILTTRSSNNIMNEFENINVSKLKNIINTVNNVHLP